MDLKADAFALGFTFTSRAGTDRTDEPVLSVRPVCLWFFFP
jgi:hypothetical protein